MSSASAAAAVLAAPRPRPIIHINGFPGTGKLTIARHLVRLQTHLNAKLVHNHLLINPADAVLHRTQPGYQDLRRAIRSALFASLISEPATHDAVYIFTDFQSADPLGESVCREYESAAAARGCAFIPVLLHCDTATNLTRLVSHDREVHAKLMDVELVRSFREQEECYRFAGQENLLELDVTTLAAEEAASKIVQHVRNVVPELQTGL